MALYFMPQTINGNIMPCGMANGSVAPNFFGAKSEAGYCFYFFLFFKKFFPVRGCGFCPPLLTIH
ncbi:hypothetical protein COU37_03865 [Candidatus Micrarchaeota archaeon CG10_big_fil_rev_8_21_14_0_10_45_29]|nr:MAG: hypothetical protein COU37_03865 [Candidatus Micrarchaeota archaeon CG10_big_fil_rev_8_21_14_0_10_45_29]